MNAPPPWILRTSSGLRITCATTSGRQEHLASLGLVSADQTVLEVGAGIGDHTGFFLDRRCAVTVTEAQEQNLAVLRARYPELDVRKLDLDEPPREAIG